VSSVAFKKFAGPADTFQMTDDDLEEVAAHVRVLIQEELDVQHRLGGHPAPVEDCPLCRYRMASSAGRPPQPR